MTTNQTSELQPQEVLTQPLQQDPPSKKLWQVLIEEDLYSRPYEEFVNQYSNEEAFSKLHSTVVELDLYSGTADDLIKQYFPDYKKKDQPISTTEVGNGLPGGVSVFGTFIQPKAEEQPILGPYQPIETEVVATPKKGKGEVIVGEAETLPPIAMPYEEGNPIDLVLEKKELLQEYSKSVENEQMVNASMIMGKVDEINKKLSSMKIDDNAQKEIEKDVADFPFEKKVAKKPRVVDSKDPFLTEEEKQKGGYHYDKIPLKQRLAYTREKDPSRYKEYLMQYKIGGLVEDQFADDEKSGKDAFNDILYTIQGGDYTKNIPSGISGIQYQSNRIKGIKDKINQYFGTDKLGNPSENAQKANQIVDDYFQTSVYANFNDKDVKEFLSQKLNGTKLQPNIEKAIDVNAAITSEIDESGNIVVPPYLSDQNLDNYDIVSIANNLDLDDPVVKAAFDRYSSKAVLENALGANTKYDNTTGEEVTTYNNNKPWTEEDFVKSAVSYVKLQNPEVEEQIGSLGTKGIPKELEGQMVWNFLSNTDIIKRARDNADFGSTYNKVKNTFEIKYPEYAETVVAQLISQELENRGETNWLVNIPTQENVDNIVGFLRAGGKITPAQEMIYRERLRGDIGVLQSIYRGLARIPFGAFVEKSKIETPGILENVQNSLNSQLESTAKGITDLSPFYKTNTSQRLYNLLSKNATNIAVDYKKAHEISAGTGHLLGFVLALYGTRGLLGTMGVDKGAETINLLLSFEGNNRDNAILYFPNDPTKQFGYVAASTIGDMTLGHLLPTKQLQQAFNRVYKPNVRNIITALGDGKITANQAKEKLRGLTSLLIKVGGKNLEQTAVMQSFHAYHEAIDKMFNAGEAKDKSGGQIILDAINGGKMTFLETTALSLLGTKGFGDLRSSHKILWEIGNDPKKYREMIEKEAKVNPEIDSQKKEMLENLNVIEKVTESLKDTGMEFLSLEQKQKYLRLSAQKAITERKAKQSGDANIAEQYKDKINEYDAQMKKILDRDNPDVAEELTTYEMDENKPETTEIAETTVEQLPFEGIDQKEIIVQMKPFTDKMVDIEREFNNNGYEINTDYDNEIQILDKNGEQVEPEDLPNNLKDLAADYEKATMKLGDFDASAREKALAESRQITDVEAEVVEETKRIESPKEPTQEQIEDDLKNKRFATFTYENESQVPDQFRDKISSRGEINGKPFVKVTLPKSIADYELSKQEGVKPTEAKAELPQQDRSSWGEQEYKNEIKKLQKEDEKGNKEQIKQLTKELGDLIIDLVIKGAEKPKEAPKEEVAKVETESEEVTNIKEAINKYEEGDNTFNDFVDEVEGIAFDTENQKLQDAIDAYREEQAEDFKLAGRGDMDAAESAFISKVREELNKLQVEKPKEKDDTKRVVDNIKALLNSYIQSKEQFEDYKKMTPEERDQKLGRLNTGMTVEKYESMLNAKSKEVAENIKPFLKLLGYEFNENVEAKKLLDNIDINKIEKGETKPIEVKPTETTDVEETTIEAGGLRNVELKMRRPEKNEIIFVPVEALLQKHAADQPSYDIQKEDNRIKGRVEKAKEFIKNYIKDQRAINPRTGERMKEKVSFEPSVVDIDATGKISFEDGRHRVLAAKEMGLTEVPIEVPKGKGKAVESLLGVAKEPIVKPTEAKAPETTTKIDRVKSIIAQVRGNLSSLSGDANAKLRQEIIEALTGEKLPKSKAGVGKLKEVVENFIKITPDSEAGKVSQIKKWAESVSETKPIEQPTEGLVGSLGNADVEIKKNKIEGTLLNEKQAAELQKEIESKYIDSATELFSKEKDDIRTKLYTYENPLAQKNVNGVDLRVAEGLIEVDKNTGEKRKTYLLYADGKIVGKFYSVKDIKDVVKIIEDNLVKSLPSKSAEKPTEKTLITSEKAKGLLSKFKKVEETPTEETKTEIKIVEDEAENGIINEKLTEKDNLEQEPSITAIESKAANTSRATEKDLEKVIAEIDSKIGEATDVKTVPLESLNTDEARFQNRAELNDAIVNDIAKNWRDANQDPIHVWTDPKDGKTYVLSGHHRYYGAKKAGRNVVKIIDRSKDYTEAEAIKFAKEEANANRSMETPLERANALRAKRERGDSKEEINTFLEREGKGKIFINNLSFLNPFGKTMQMLKSLTAAEDRKTQKEAEQVSDWIGEARRLMPDLTDAHESEMYDFLMDADASQRITKKADFVQKVRSALNNFDITEPLNLRRFKYKTLGEEQYDRDVYEKKALIEERQNQINELNERFSNPSSPNYISTDSPNFSEARKIANDKIATLDAERKILQKQLEDIYRNKGRYTGGPSTGTLFSVEKNRTAAEAEMTDAVEEIVKDNPEASETEVVAFVSQEVGDNSNAFRTMVSNSYAEAKNRQTEQIVRNPIIRRINKAFLGIKTVILENANQLKEMASKLTGARYNVEESAGFVTRDGKKIGFVFDTDKVARERFDFSKLTQIGQGSDRVVFDLGDGKVLKVAKTARGLEQNIYEGEPYLGHILPEVYERGLNYVVVEATPRLRSSDIVPTYDVETGVENGTTTAGQMIKDLSKFNQRDFDQRKAELQDVLAKYGFSDILSYEILYGDFNALRNWGYKNGMPMHLDGGTFGGVRMIQDFRGKKNLEDADFRDIYYKSKKLKKEYADKDKYTMFHYNENGDILGFTHDGIIYLNGEKVTAKTTMEEAGHIWVNNVKEFNKDLYRAGMDKVVGSKYLESVKSSEFYKKEAKKQGAEGSKEYEDYMKEEALAKAISDEGAKFATQTQKASFKAWVYNMWKSVAKHFGIRNLSVSEIKKMTLEEFAQKAAADIFSKAKSESRPEAKKDAVITPSKTNTVEIKTDNPYLYLGETKTRQSGLKKHLLEATNLSAEMKENFKKNLGYKVAKNSEATKVASAIISSFGRKDALQIARGLDMHPSVRSAIFAELINDAASRERNAKNETDRLEALTDWVEISTEYDQQLTGAGQFGAYAREFYDKSPLGFIIKENQKTNERFDQWYEDKYQSYEDLYNDLISSAEGKSLIEQEFERRYKDRIEEEGAKKAEQQVEKLYQELPQDKKTRADKALAALDRMQARIRSKRYSDVTGIVAFVDAGITTIKAAIKAGVSVSRAIEIGIEEIREKYQRTFNRTWEKEDEFRRDMLEGFKAEGVEDVTPTVEKTKNRVENLKNKIEEFKKKKRDVEAGKVELPEKKEPKEKTEEEIELEEQLKEAKDEYNAALKRTPEWAAKKSEELLNLYRAKMKDMNEEQKKKVINNAIKKLLDAGALEHDDFKQIIADAIGFKQLNAKQIDRIKELNEIINKVDEIEKEMVDNPNPTTIKNYEQALRDSTKAQKELRDMTYKESDNLSLFKSFISGSLMGIPTLIKNVGNNVFLQALIRFTTAAVKGFSQQLLKYITLGNYKPTSSLWMAQKGYFGSIPKSFREAIFNFKHGTQSKNLFDKSSYQSQIAPKQAVRDLKLWKQGDLFLSKKDVFNRVARATLGWQSNFILKSLGFGDLFQRRGAERSAGIQIARLELGITNQSQIEAFLLSPEKFSYKIFIDKGVAPDQAAARAQEIRERIESRGSRAVLEEDNWLYNVSKWLDAGLQPQKDENLPVKTAKSVVSLIKTSTFPFIRIPSNAYWVMIKTAIPEFTFLYGVGQGYLSLDYAKKKNNAESRKYAEDAIDNVSLAVVGMGLRVAVDMLVQDGLVRSANDDDNKVREVTGERLYGKQNQINMGKLVGSSQDFWIDLNWFGPMGSMMNVRAQMNDDRLKDKLKGSEQEATYLNDLVGRMSYSTAESLNLLVLEQGSRTIEALKSGDGFRVWSQTQLNTAQNMVFGASFAALSKAMIPYEARTKADNAVEEALNNAKYRNLLVRMWAGMPPARISIWGDKIMKDNSPAGVLRNMFGVEKNNPNNFGIVLFNEFVRTQDPRFFPSPMNKYLMVNGKKEDLTVKQREELEISVGKYRKMLVDPFLAGQAQFMEKTYDQLNDEEKVEALEAIYKMGLDAGVAEFTMNPENVKFVGAKMTPDKMAEEAQIRAWKEMFKFEMKSRLPEEFNLPYSPLEP